MGTVTNIQQPRGPQPTRPGARAGTPTPEEVPQWSPLELAADPTVRVVDIRPAAERLGELGFIPGSRSVPDTALLSHRRQAFWEFEPGDRLALACLTGRRSEALVPMVKAMGFAEVGNLKGGILAWSAAHLPLCTGWVGSTGRPIDEEALAGLPRAIASCFVAESVENALNRDLMDAFNPMEAVREIFAQERVSWQHPSPVGLVRVLDALAEKARRRGHPLDRIADNVSSVLASVRAAV